MKTITVKISDKVFKELKTHMGLKCMTGEVYGMTDAVLIRMIKAVDNGESEVGMKAKGEKDDDILSDKVSDSS